MQYTRIPNAWTNDRTLSLKALGLAMRIAVEPTIKHTIGALSASGPDGTTAVRAALAELERAGIVEVRRGLTAGIYMTDAALAQIEATR